MAGRRFPSRFPARPFFAHSDRSDWLELWRRDLPVRPRLALIANLDPPVFPFARHHLGLPVAARIFMSSFWHIRPNCVTGTFPCSCSFSVGSRTYTFFQSVYRARGTPYFSIHCRHTRAAAQMVSSSPRQASTVEVASSTMFIRQARGPRF